MVELFGNIFAASIIIAPGLRKFVLKFWAKIRRGSRDRAS